MSCLPSKKGVRATPMLLHSLVMSAVLQTLAGDNDFAKCTSASTCPAWKAMVESSGTKVAIKEKVESMSHDGKYDYFRVEVTPGSGAGTFHVFRRYSEFRKLHDTLVDGLEFPPRQWNRIAEYLWPETLEQRGAKLETWLQEILKKAESEGESADALFSFLDPARAQAAAKSGISMPPDSNIICMDLALRDTHYFGINVTLTPGTEPIKVFHRFKDFEKLNASLAELTPTESDFLATLPPKIFWSKVIALWEAKVDERRRGLETWLQQVKMHPESAPGGLWAEKVNEFLDFRANQKEMTFKCKKDNIVYAKMSDIQKNYAAFKDAAKDSEL